jgi:hypothetical protein
MTLTNSTSLTTRAQNRDVTDDTDPAAAPTRRTCTPEQKLAILAPHEDATEPAVWGPSPGRPDPMAPTARGSA